MTTYEQIKQDFETCIKTNNEVAEKVNELFTKAMVDSSVALDYTSDYDAIKEIHDPATALSDKRARIPDGPCHHFYYTDLAIRELLPELNDLCNKAVESFKPDWYTNFNEVYQQLRAAQCIKTHLKVLDETSRLSGVRAVKVKSLIRKYNDVKFNGSKTLIDLYREVKKYYDNWMDKNASYKWDPAYNALKEAKSRLGDPQCWYSYYGSLK